MEHIIRIKDNLYFNAEISLEKMILTMGIRQQKRIFKQIMKFPWENEDLISELDSIFEEISEGWKKNNVQDFNEVVYNSQIGLFVESIRKQKIGAKEMELLNRTIEAWRNANGLYVKDI